MSLEELKKQAMKEYEELQKQHTELMPELEKRHTYGDIDRKARHLIALKKDMRAIIKWLEGKG